MRFLITCLLACCAAGPARADSWVPKAAPYNGDVRSLAFANGSVFAGTYGGGAWRSANAAATWSMAHSGIADYYVRALCAGANADVFAGAGWAVYRTTNDGAGWMRLRDFPAAVRALTVGRAGLADEILFAATDSGIAIAKDDGTTWRPLRLGNVAPIVAVAVDPAGDAYCATAASGVYRSTDGGGTWFPTALAAGGVLCLAVDASGDIFAGAHGVVHRSANGGQSWDTLALPAAADVRSLVSPQDGTLLAAQSPGGVSRSEDGGDTWQAFQSGIASVYAGLLALDPEGFAYCVSGARLYRTAETATDNGDLPGAPPRRTAALSRLPNPFNPTAWLRYEVTAAGHVDLEVLDARGRRVAGLVSRRVDAGRYTVRWDADPSLPSGVYVSRLRVAFDAGGSIARASSKLLLLK